MTTRMTPTRRRRQLYRDSYLDIQRHAVTLASSSSSSWLIWEPDPDYEVELFGPTIRVSYAFWQTTGGQLDQIPAAYLQVGLIRIPAPGGGVPAGILVSDQDERWISRHYLPYAGRAGIPLETVIKLRYAKLRREESIWLVMEKPNPTTNGVQADVAVQATAGFKAIEVGDPGRLQLPPRGLGGGKEG